MIDIGRLDTKIVIQTPTDTRDDQGGYTPGWATFTTCYANVTYPDTEKEAGEADRNAATIKGRFKIRYVAGVTEKMRISIDSTYFNITSTVPLGRKEGLLIKAEKKV